MATEDGAHFFRQENRTTPTVRNTNIGKCGVQITNSAFQPAKTLGGFAPANVVAVQIAHGVCGGHAGAADSRSPERELRRAPRFERQRFLPPAPDQRPLCPGPPCRQERGGRLSAHRNRSSRSANFSLEQNGQVPRHQEALAASLYGERGEFSYTQRARRRVPGACRPRFPPTPCPRCGRSHLHRVWLTQAPGRTALELVGATKPRR